MKYKYLSQCKDFETLENECSEGELTEFENTIAEYEETRAGGEAFEDSQYYGCADIINWYEGLITTEDLLEWLE